MVSLLGPPPKKFLERHVKSRQYWDSEGRFCLTFYRTGLFWVRENAHANTCVFPGNWIASTPIPDQSLESRETKLEGEEKQQLLNLVRKVLSWLPENRMSADQLYGDAFINGYKRDDGDEAPEQTS